MANITDAGNFPEMQRRMFSLQRNNRFPKLGWESWSWRTRLGHEQACHAAFKKQLGMPRDRALHRVRLAGALGSRLAKQDDWANQFVAALFR